MVCDKCKNNLFFINIIPCCDDCDQNSSWDCDTQEYVTGLKTIELEGLNRDQVENDGECGFGTAHGDGCRMFICSKCKFETNWPSIEGC